MNTLLAPIFHCNVVISFLCCVHFSPHSAWRQSCGVCAHGPALIFQGFKCKCSPEIQIYILGWGKLFACVPRLRWVWTRLLHFWPHRNLGERRITNVLTLFWPCGEIPTTPHNLKTEPEYFIQFIRGQSRAHSGAGRRLFLIIKYLYYQYCLFVCFFSLQSIASAASGKIMCNHIKTSGESNISLLSF